MKYLTLQDYEEELRKIRLKNQDKIWKQKLKEEKNKYKRKKKLPSTSKLILIGAVLLCLQIILFCEYLMWKTNDLTAMYVLIGIAASLASIVLGYFLKSKAENTTGGIVYDTAMEELRQIGKLNCEEDTEDESVYDEDNAEEIEYIDEYNDDETLE